MMRTAAPGILALLLASAAHAQIAQQVSLQGRLEDPPGVPMSGSVSLAIRIYGTVTGGTPAFVEDDVVTLGTGGHFVTVLGDGAALDPTLFESPRWVSLEVDAGGELFPRLEVLPAPSALRAASAAGLVPGGPVDFGGQALTGLPSPSSGDAAATRDYADAVAASVQTSVDALAGSVSAHVGDASVHFTQAEISLLASQVSDLDSAVSTSTHAGRTDNPHAVTKAQVGLGNLADTLSNLTAVVPPTAADDFGEGYSNGSLWVDMASQAAYLMTTSSPPAAWPAIAPSRKVVRVPLVYSGGSPDPVASGAALEAAMAGITGASLAAPVEVVLEPGIYEVTASFALKNHVALAGAGRELTILRPATTIGTVVYTRIRDLTIEKVHADADVIEAFGGTELRLERVGIRGTGLTDPAVGYRAFGVHTESHLIDCHIQLEGSGASYIGMHLWGVFGNEERFLVHGGSLDVSGPGAEGIRFQAIDLRVEGVAITTDAPSGTSSGIRTDGLFADLEVVGGVLRVGATDTARALDFDSNGAFRVQGARLEASGNSAGGLRVVEATRILASDLDISVTGGSSRGVHITETGAPVTLQGNQVSGSGTTLFEGIRCAGSAVAVSGNTITGTHSGAGVGRGIYLSGNARDSLAIAGNAVAVQADGFGELRGIDVEGDRVAASGNSVRATQSTTGVGTLTGIYSLAPGSFSGNQVEVGDSGGGSCHGVGLALDDAGGFEVSGSEVRVACGGNATGIRMTSGDLALSATRIDVQGGSFPVYGLEVAEDLWASNVDMVVDSMSGASVGVLADPTTSPAEYVRMSSSRMKVTAQGGTSRAVDHLTNAPQDPDLYVSFSVLEADATGANLLCRDASVCP